MKKILLGATLIATCFASFSAAHALAQYADARPMFPKQFTCWGFDHVDADVYQQRSIAVEATGPNQALALCMRRHQDDIKRRNTYLRHA